MGALIFQCAECEWTGPETEIARVDDPAGSGTVWNICPECRAAEQFVNMCDETGCTAEATCGWPSDTGYRRTCFKHMEKMP